MKKEIYQKVKRQKKELNKLVPILHDKVFEKIDCLECANCCTSIPPIVTNRDVKRIARFLNVKEADFQAKYTLIDEDGDQVMNQSPCPFLDDNNYCKIYIARPQACAGYPHTNEGDFAKLFPLHLENRKICPAVDKILDRVFSSLK